MEKDNFLVVQAYHPQKTVIGDFIYRIEQPSRAMGQISDVNVVNININSPYLRPFCMEADVLVIHNMSDQDMLPIIEKRRRLGRPNVFEISDNFLAFQPRDPMAEYFRDPINLSTTFQNIYLADAVQVSAKEIEDTFGFLNSRFIVFENHLMDQGEFFRRTDEQVVIGWAGSLSHLDDLQWIGPHLVEFVKGNLQVRFHYMGARKGLKYFAGIPESRMTYIPTGTLYDYYHFLETLDIGLAPLLNTAYNRCRSDIKFVEYASRGVVPVLSKCPPYEKNPVDGVTARLFADGEDMQKVLGDLVENGDLRRRIARNAYDYVMKNRLEESQAGQKIAFYQSLGGERAEKQIPMHLLTSLNGDHGAYGGAYGVKESEAERLTAQALERYEKGDLEGEWKLYQEAISSMPEYHIPCLWLGDSLSRQGNRAAVDFLEEAVRRYPESIRSEFLLGLTLLQRDREAARRHFRRALEVSSLYAPAWDALGRLEEQSGYHERALGFFNQAINGNPFYSLALLGLARVNLAMGKKSEALQALAVARDILPDHDVSRRELSALIQKAEAIGNIA